MENKFEVGPRKFSLVKLDAFKQFHIARRMGPILADLVPELQGLMRVKNFDKLPEDDKLERLSKLAGPFMTGISKLTDEDANYVLFGLLASIQVQQASGNWANVYANDMLMINDLELPVLLNIASRAFMFNLSGFFAGLPR